MTTALFLLVACGGAQPPPAPGPVVLPIADPTGVAGTDHAPQAVITVSAKDLGPFNRRILGVSQQEMWNTNRPGSRYAWGAWNPEAGRCQPDVAALTRAAGLTVIRIMGAMRDWEKERLHVAWDPASAAFGWDEYMTLCREMGLEPIVCYANLELDCAPELLDFIRYMNDRAEPAVIRELAALGRGVTPEARRRLYERHVPRPGGRKHWGNFRAINGHVEPYRLRYIELGNESYVCMKTEFYLAKYLDLHRRIKAIDPAIRIGFPAWTYTWTETLMSGIRDRVDFAVAHLYPTPFADLAQMTPEAIYRLNIAQPTLADEPYLLELSRILERYAGKRVPLAITEYNTGYVAPNAVDRYTYALGGSLVLAELMGVFARLQDRILLAAHFTFVNCYNGVITNNGIWASEDVPPAARNQPYFTRPIYDVLKFYGRHFGDVLLAARVHCDSYLIDPHDHAFFGYQRRVPGRAVGPNLVEHVGWTKQEASGVEVKDLPQDGLEVVFRAPAAYYYAGAFKECPVESRSWYRLSGEVKTDHLAVDHHEMGVRLTAVDARGWNVMPWAQCTEDVDGTCDWIPVERAFTTPLTTTRLRLQLERNGSKPPLSGSALVRNLALHRFAPDPAQVPILSVTASRSLAGDTVYLIIVNRSMECDVSTAIELDGFAASGRAVTRVLWADKPGTNNEAAPHDQVRVHESEAAAAGTRIRLDLRRHSLTAVEIPVRR